MKTKGVFLTGGRGFLGIHILKELLDETDVTIYCLVRGRPDTYSDDFKQRFTYFFGEYDAFQERIKLLNGDFSEQNFALNETEFQEVNASTNVVIHAGAYVKHFGKKEDFIRNNCLGTENITKYAYINKKYMIYISSMAVSGKYAENEDDIFQERILSKQEFYSDNIYIKSKVLAENIFTKYVGMGLSGQLIRVGALTGRKNDGVFQLNHLDNAFYARLWTIIASGLIPDFLLDYKIEFTPVDQCAEAIVMLLKNTEINFCVFHLFNDNYLTFKELIELFKEIKIEIEPIEVKSFSEYKARVKQSVDSRQIRVGFCLFLRNYTNRKGRMQNMVSCKNTKEGLSALGFQWLKVDAAYLKKIIQWMGSENGKTILN